MGCINSQTVKLQIDANVRPVKQKLRPVAVHLQDAVTKELENQVKEGVLERVHSWMGPTPWISNLVVVPKKDKTSSANKDINVRLTCDSRQLNKALKRVRYPSKNMEDLIYEVNGAKKFTKLDIRKAFHQLTLDQDSRHLTTITTHCGLFRYKRLHMGISCASEEFTECIRQILEGIPGQINMTDDILVYGATDQEHDDSLMQVLTRLEEHGITLNSEKCEIGKSELTFFGLRMSEKGIAPTEDRCRALREAKPPANVKELRSLLGTVQFSSRFIKHTCMITEPLWRLTKKNAEWKWTPLHDQSLRKLKESITSQHMAYFNKQWETELIVDASPVGLGAVLVQINPKDTKDRKIIAFASRLLSETERRYSQCEKEALAAVWACEKFWIYLIGSKFRLVTDNRAVQLIFNNTACRPPARIERWALRLSQFDFNIIHRPGISNVADYFSRQPVGSNESKEESSEKSEAYINAIAESSRPHALTMSEMIKHTNLDQELNELKTHMTSGNKKLAAKMAHYGQIISEITQTSDGLMLRGSRIIVPKSLQRRTIELAHQGHQGVVKTKALIRSKVWFSGIDKMVDEMVLHCTVCQANSTNVRYAPLMPSKMPEGPWQEVSGDFFGPMQDGSYYLVNHDDYSRWPATDPTRSTSFKATKQILDKLFGTLGVPLKYKTDNGPPFNSYEFAEYARQKGFIHQKITPKWPRANGEVERFMKNLGKVLKASIVAGRNKDEELSVFLRAYRETPHSTTQVPPAILLLGFARTSGIPQVENLDFEKLKKLHEFARANDEKAKARMKAEFDARMRVCEPQIRVGRRVLVKLEQKLKSDPFWDPDPYVVVQVKGSLVTAKRGSKETTRNICFFKPLVTYNALEHDDNRHTQEQKAHPEHGTQSKQRAFPEQHQERVKTRRVGRPPRKDLAGETNEALTTCARKANVTLEPNQTRRSERLAAKVQSGR